jgi:hypothetical protein
MIIRLTLRIGHSKLPSKVSTIYVHDCDSRTFPAQDYQTQIVRTACEYAFQTGEVLGCLRLFIYFASFGRLRKYKIDTKVGACLIMEKCPNTLPEDIQRYRREQHTEIQPAPSAEEDYWAMDGQVVIEDESQTEGKGALDQLARCQGKVNASGDECSLPWPHRKLRLLGDDRHRSCTTRW